MLKKLSALLEDMAELFESTGLTIVSGVFLLADLVPHIMGYEPIFHFAWVSVAISGMPLVYSAIRRLVRNKGLKRISSALLISIAMICALAIGDVFAAGEVAFIMAFGEILEEKTTAKAKKGLGKLIALTPKTARRLQADTEDIIPYDSIQVGDILRVLPGEAVPCDGEIISGETSVDESILTGEAIPVDKAIGDMVFCGTINRFGVIEIRATKIGEDSTLERLIKMVQDTESKKAPTERIADRWASILVPVALATAVLAGLIRGDIVVAVTVLVVFCPCALVLATPTAIMAAIGQATKHGVIIKSGEALEKMGDIDTVAFDKTGTLTTGRLTVCDVISFDGHSSDEILSLAAAVESMSKHPLGMAITDYAKANGISFSAADDFSMASGKGVSGTANGMRLYCGNKRYIEESGAKITEEVSAALLALQKDGKATVALSTNKSVLGVVALSDTLRPQVRDMISALGKARTKSVLLTGDNPQTAGYFAKKVGIADIYAGLLPQDKLAKIESIQKGGGKVAMIGDGVNDAPALKCADVGIAMGDMGSDIAIDAADITLIGDDISKIPYLKRLANSTVATIRFGIALSLTINLIGIVLSFMRVLTPVTGALVHNAGSLLVIFIAAMLYERKF